MRKIGYVEMDFVMDGGQQTQSNIQKNIAAFGTLSADFFLLQEVDERSKHSYRCFLTNHYHFDTFSNNFNSGTNETDFFACAKGVFCDLTKKGIKNVLS